MIWDPVKQFACLCKDGFVGERCEKCMPDMNVLFIVNKTNEKCRTHAPMQLFLKCQTLARSRRRISIPSNAIQTIDEINPLIHYLFFETHSKCHV